MEQLLQTGEVLVFASHGLDGLVRLVELSSHLVDLGGVSARLTLSAL